MKEGGLVVVDAGAEQYYATDVTRTYPVSGKFSPEQREIYEIVLKAQAAGIAAAKAGVTPRHAGARRPEGDRRRRLPRRVPARMLSLRGPRGTTPATTTRHSPRGRCSRSSRASTCRSVGFGVRIEDEILVTAGGAEVITKAVPKDPDEIERRMQTHRADAR